MCGLTPARDGRLHAAFWLWRWDRAPQPLDVAPIAPEFRAARVAMLDGPQALACPGTALRVCERRPACVGKTPDTRPALSKPFAGFIRSSLDLFAALKAERIAVSPPVFTGGVSEVYPGHIWTILSGRRPLPRKATEAGRRVRKRILEALGLSGLPALPTHDENDAAVAALVAAAADNQVSGVSVHSLGDRLSIDPDGVLREGPMIVPELTPAVAARLAELFDNFSLPEPPPTRVSEPPAAAPRDGSAEDLLAYFIAKAREGDPQVCTYAWAYRHLFNATYTKYSPAYTQRVIQLASRTPPRDLPGLGLVRLDAFIVSKKDGLPSAGYWPAAQHDREDWERALGNAKILD